MATRSKTAQKLPVRPARRATAPTSKRYRPTPGDMSDKGHLISVVQQTTGSSKKAAKEAVDALIGTVTATLRKNQKVQLTGFGSFQVVVRPARTARNPRTGEPIKVKRSKSVRFKPGQTLKAAM